MLDIHIHLDSFALADPNAIGFRHEFLKYDFRVSTQPLGYCTHEH